MATGVARLVCPEAHGNFRWMVEVVWVACAMALAWDAGKQQMNWTILGWLVLAQCVDLVLDGFLDKFIPTWKALWQALK